MNAIIFFNFLISAQSLDLQSPDCLTPDLWKINLEALANDDLLVTYRGKKERTARAGVNTM